MKRMIDTEDPKLPSEVIVFPVGETLKADALELRAAILGSARNPLDIRWRQQEYGRRRTVLMDAHSRTDRILAGGNRFTMLLLRRCANEAREIMVGLGVEDWTPRRVVVNSMAAGTKHDRHPDPDTYRSGTMVLSLGAAAFSWVNPLDGEVSRTAVDQDFIYIPPGYEHEVTDVEAQRASVVFADDEDIACGQTFVGQRARTAARHVVQYLSKAS